MIKPINVDKIPSVKKNRSNKYIRLIEEFIDSGVEAAEISIPGLDSHDLYMGIYYHVYRTCANYPVAVKLRLHKVYLIRDNTKT